MTDDEMRERLSKAKPLFTPKQIADSEQLWNELEAKHGGSFHLIQCPERYREDAMTQLNAKERTED